MQNFNISKFARSKFVPEMGQKDLELLAYDIKESMENINEERYESILQYVKKLYSIYCLEQNELNSVIQITENDLNYIKNIPSREDAKLMWGFYCLAKIHPHASGWIKYTNFINILCGRKVKNGELKTLIKYGFEIRVYGKNDSIVTFLDPSTLMIESVYKPENDRVLYSFKASEASKMFEVIF